MKNHEIRKLMLYLLESCFTPDQIENCFEYSSDLSQFHQLSNARTSHLNSTEIAINKMRSFTNPSQIAHHIAVLTPEVRYFVYERAMILVHVVQHERYSLTSYSPTILEGYPQQIAATLQQIWKEHLQNIAVDGVDLDTHLSHIIHNMI